MLTPRGQGAVILGRGGAQAVASPLAYYTCSNTSDSSGNGYTLTNNNAATFTSTGAKVGGAVDLELGSTQYLSSANAAFALAATSLTLACWVKFESKSGVNHGFVGRFNADAGYTLYFASGSDTFLFWIGNGTVYAQVEGNVNPSLGVWYFLCARYDRALGKLYLSVDGGAAVEANAGDATLTSGGVDLCLGADAGGAASHHDGMLDEVGVWARNIGQVGQAYLYNGGAGRTWPL